MKTCFKCGINKALSEFYRHPYMGDGHLGKCKVCTKRDVAENREARRDYYLRYNRERNVGDRRRMSDKASAAWSHANKAAGPAHTKVRRALSCGKLKQGPCEFCGDSKTVAHHDDYAKPLDVRWLCDPCHKSHHAALRGKTPWRLLGLLRKRKSA